MQGERDGGSTLIEVLSATEVTARPMMEVISRPMGTGTLSEVWRTKCA